MEQKLCPNCLLNPSLGKDLYTGGIRPCRTCQDNVDHYILVWNLMKPIPSQVISIFKSDLEKTSLMLFSLFEPIAGREIARQLGVHYDGVQEGIGMQFTDREQTGSTFYGNSFSQARTALIKMRKSFQEV